MMTDDNKIQILLSIRVEQYEELYFRRSREFAIFQWTATILLAICAILLGANGATPLDFLRDCRLKFLSVFIIGFIAIFSILWQNRERKFGAQNCRVIASINESLSLFREGAYFESKTVLPAKWADWGKKDLHRIHRFFRVNYITATWVLSGITMLIILIS